MSLTSYRAAPPRGGLSLFVPVEKGREGRGDCGPGGDLLFRTLRCSTIGAEGFHGRVRDGIGCLAPRYGHQAGKPCLARKAGLWREPRAGMAGGVRDVRRKCLVGRAPRAGGRRAAGPCRCTRAVLRRLMAMDDSRVDQGQAPVERLVPVSCAGCPASTSGLSTWWSTTALGETWF